MRRSTTDIDVPAFTSQLIMFLLCAIFTALCVRSFIAARPLSRVRTALQEMEEGNYEARLLPDGTVVPI